MSDSRRIAGRQARHVEDERCEALRALLMKPLMSPSDESYAAVLRHADSLRAWFARETGWPLHIERACARLYKRPADLSDSSRGLPGYDRRRYALLCLACAVLERADPQITLRVLGDRLLMLASEPALALRGFSFTLMPLHERRELVAVCRTLMELGVLRHVAGDEDGYIRNTSSAAEGADALYDIQRRVLGSVMAATRGPSTWVAEQAPTSHEARLDSLVAEHVYDSEEGHRTRLRHHLARRLLDDPVVYLDSLDAEQRAYFSNQRGAMASRLCEAAGLAAEQRAEGLALTDIEGALTDVAMPAEGTEAHATLLVAGFLADGQRDARSIEDDNEKGRVFVHFDEVARFLADARARFGSYWRKAAREPGSERDLADVALSKLADLKLVERVGERVGPLPALARFAVGEMDIRRVGSPASSTMVSV